jgi:hypothetical protein
VIPRGASATWLIHLDRREGGLQEACQIEGRECMITESTKSHVALPLARPPVLTWATDSHLFAMLQQSSGGRSWLMNRFVQVVTRNVADITQAPTPFFVPEGDVFTTWHDCGFLEIQQMRTAFFDRLADSFVAAARLALAKGHYLYTKIDQTRIWPDSLGLHLTFFYGYDDDREEFLVADHLDLGKYALRRAGYAAVESGYRNAGAAYREREEFYRNASNTFIDWVVLCRLVERKHAFDRDLLRADLRNYLNSSDPKHGISHGTREFPLVFGLETYDLIQKYLWDLQNGFTDMHDVRTLTMVRDHKNLMRDRFRYLSTIDDHDYRYLALSDRYAELGDLSETVLMLFLKHMASHDPRIIDRARTRLEGIRETESKLLRDLV